jgi:hypothetical protein
MSMLLLLCCSDDGGDADASDRDKAPSSTAATNGADGLGGVDGVPADLQSFVVAGADVESVDRSETDDGRSDSVTMLVAGDDIEATIDALQAAAIADGFVDHGDVADGAARVLAFAHDDGRSVAVRLTRDAGSIRVVVGLLAPAPSR